MYNVPDLPFCVGLITVGDYPGMLVEYSTGIVLLLIHVVDHVPFSLLEHGLYSQGRVQDSPPGGVHTDCSTPWRVLAHHGMLRHTFAPFLVEFRRFSCYQHKKKHLKS